MRHFLSYFQTLWCLPFGKIGYISFGRWDVKCIWKRWAIKWKQFEKEVLNFSIFKYDSNFKCMKAFTLAKRRLRKRQFHSISILSLLKAWLVQVLCAKELGKDREDLCAREVLLSPRNANIQSLINIQKRDRAKRTAVAVFWNVNKQLNFELKM